MKSDTEHAVSAIIWNELVNNYGPTAEVVLQPYYRYKWGDKVFVDFGCSSIQTELAYPHPAIVLYNFEKSVLIAPTSSDDSASALNSDIQKLLIKAKKDGMFFFNDTLINMHQIQVVHKKRIIKSLKCNVSQYNIESAEIDRLNNIDNTDIYYYGMNLLDCMRCKLMIRFGSSVFKNYYDELLLLKNDINKKDELIKTLSDEIEFLKNNK